MKDIDILYLGCNMGNCWIRFFSRYPKAREDYYATFVWLVMLKQDYPHLNIAIKHHGGHYKVENDLNELAITKDITYIDNQLDSYELCRNSKLVVCYFTTMILELRGYPNLSLYIRDKRRRRHELIRRPCNREVTTVTNIRHNNAYFLDPYGRNRHFCRYMDEICVHDCNGCEPHNLEVYEPYRIKSYKQFHNKVKEVICSVK